MAVGALKVGLRRPSIHQLDVLNTSELHYIKLMHILTGLNWLTFGPGTGRHGGGPIADLARYRERRKPVD